MSILDKIFNQFNADNTPTFNINEKEISKKVVTILVKGIDEAKSFGKHLKRVGINNIISDSDDKYMTISVASKDYYRSIAEIANYCNTNKIKSFNYCSPSGKIIKYTVTAVNKLERYRSESSFVVTFMCSDTKKSNKITSLLRANDIETYSFSEDCDAQVPFAEYQSISMESKYYHYAIALISKHLSTNVKNIYYCLPGLDWCNDFSTIANNNSLYYDIKNSDTVIN